VARRAFSGKHPVLRRLFNASRRWKRRKRTEHVQRETVVQASR
jgi:hypothetical protein